MSTIFNRKRICTAVLLAMAPMGAALAEDDSGGGLNMEEIVTVGTAKPKAKIDSTNAVTTFDEEKMTRLAPASVGELVRSIPGFHAEDTGGETGNNIAPRGFPLTTQMEFTALQRDGMTVFYNQDVLFTQADRFTRASTFIGNVEAVRGGASSIFVGSAPAGYINFVSREGGDDTEGDVAFETNTNNRVGLKGWVSGSINDQTTYAIGAWYREDDTGRDPGYVANQGGELNGNIKYRFKEGNGYTKFEFNKQDDKSFFFIPQPLTGTTKDPETIPGGMDIRDGTTGNSASARYLRIPNTPSGDINLDIADGNYADVTYFGNTTSIDLNETWTLKNQVRYTDLYTTFTGIINVGQAELLSIKAQDIFDDNSALLADALVDDELQYEIRDAGTGFALADNSNVDTWNTNGMGIDAGFWYRGFDADNVQNDFRLQNLREMGDGGFLTATYGVFFSNINGQVTDHRINTLQSIENLPQRLDIAYVDEDGNDLANGTYKGILPDTHDFAHAIYSERSIAPFVDFEYETGPFTLNFGARYEKLEANGEVENKGEFRIDSFAPSSEMLNGTLGPVNGAIELPFGNSTFRDFEVEYDELAWTVGANWKISDTLALSARYADGFRMPDVDRYLLISGMENAEEIAAFNDSKRIETEPVSTVMAEIGLKYSSGPVSAFVTGFFASADDVLFNTPTVEDGELVTRGELRNTETLGLEAEISANIMGGWHAGVSFTVQDPEFVDTPDEAFEDSDGNIQFVKIEGKIPRRVPEHFGQITTRYDFENFDWGFASVNASYSWSGRRYADDANNSELSQYGMLNLGASVETNDGFYVRADVKNINNSEGLSEGDPRSGESVGTATPTFNARVVLPQTWTLIVGKRF